MESMGGLFTLTAEAEVIPGEPVKPEPEEEEEEDQ